jgi:hypothetical protein
VIIFLFAGSSFAVDKIGTSSILTLKLSSDVRAIAMGDALSGLSWGVNSVFTNPAGVNSVKNWDIAFNQINMPADIQFNSASVVRNLEGMGFWGLHVINLYTDDMKERTVVHPEGTGRYFNAYEYAVGVTFGYRLTDHFVFGSNVRVFGSNLSSGLEDDSYTGLSFDLGTHYQTNFRSLGLGIVIQNWGPDIKYSGNYMDYRNFGSREDDALTEKGFEQYPLPSLMKVGIGFDVFTMVNKKIDGQILNCGIEMIHPNDNREGVNAGLEWGYHDMFFMRGGYKFESDVQTWTAGLGIKYPLDLISNSFVKFDFAYSPWGEISDGSDGFMTSPYRFSIGLEF